MKIINAGFQILSNFNGIEMLKNIEYIARTCYKSENMITDSGYHFESASELTILLYLQTGAAKAAIIRR